MDLMVDLETLDTSNTATILTIGAVKFDPELNSKFEEFYCRVDIDSQDKLGSTISDDTIQWWSEQSQEAKDEAFSDEDRISIEEAIDKFHKFAWTCDKFWSHGSCFDLMILEHVYRGLGRNVPWNYYDIRDTRTLFDLADPQMPQSGKHNALEDAKRQAIGVRNVLFQLNNLRQK